jgi:hypothetical protein
MRFRNTGLVVVATVLLVAPVLLHTVARRAAAQDVKTRKRPVMIQASPAILPTGTACMVTLNVEKQGQIETTLVYEGTIVSATDEGMTLTVKGQTEVTTGKATYASNIPLVGPLFTANSIRSTKPDAKKDVWIPSEKIQLVSLSRAKQ